MNGAELIVKTLLANGIDTCFANPGTSEMHFVAALDRHPQMRCVLGLFEGVVTGAADGYARMADKPAATLLHLGPGLANGLANIHNARRGGTAMINVVGEHATYHLQHDAPLTTDIDSLAAPMSNWVGRVAKVEEAGSTTGSAIAAARSRSGQIATLILHADAAWNACAVETTVPMVAPPAFQAPDMSLVRKAAAALRNGRRTTILVSGMALREAPLILLDRIAANAGARVAAQQANGRMQCGAGRVTVLRVPYPVDDAQAFFAGTEQLILIGAKSPVSFFAYPNKNTDILPDTCEVIELADSSSDLPAVIAALAGEAGTAASARTNLRVRHDAPVGKLTPDAIAVSVSALMQEGSVVCDETITSGGSFPGLTTGAEAHDFLQLTGGAIGTGIPMATGAAVACPGRKVICLQADGSGMYTVQGLWTQAREQLDVVTIIYANRRYQILHHEFSHVGAGTPGENARSMLDLDDPALDWVMLAKGMGVEAARVDTAEAFHDVLRMALARKGPFLIEAMI